MHLLQLDYLSFSVLLHLVRYKDNAYFLMINYWGIELFIALFFYFVVKPFWLLM